MEKRHSKNKIRIIGHNYTEHNTANKKEIEDKNDDKMSDSDSSKSDLDKDDEDFLLKLEASKSKSDKESDKEKKDGKTTPEKTAKKYKK